MAAAVILQIILGELFFSSVTVLCILITVLCILNQVLIPFYVTILYGCIHVITWQYIIILIDVSVHAVTRVESNCACINIDGMCLVHNHVNVTHTILIILGELLNKYDCAKVGHVCMTVYQAHTIYVYTWTFAFNMVTCMHGLKHQ